MKELLQGLKNLGKEILGSEDSDSFSPNLPENPTPPHNGIWSEIEKGIFEPIEQKIIQSYAGYAANNGLSLLLSNIEININSIQYQQLLQFLDETFGDRHVNGNYRNQKTKKYLQDNILDRLKYSGQTGDISFSEDFYIKVRSIEKQNSFVDSNIKIFRGVEVNIKMSYDKNQELKQIAPEITPQIMDDNPYVDIEIIDASSQKRQVRIDKFPTRIGRSKSLSHIVIDCPYVSGEHLEFNYEDKKLMVTFLSNSHPSYLNGEKIEVSDKNPRQLTKGSILKLVGNDKNCALCPEIKINDFFQEGTIQFNAKELKGQNKENSPNLTNDILFYIKLNVCGQSESIPVSKLPIKLGRFWTGPVGCFDQYIPLPESYTDEHGNLQDTNLSIPHMAIKSINTGGEYAKALIEFHGESGFMVFEPSINKYQSYVKKQKYVVPFNREIILCGDGKNVIISMEISMEK